MLSLDIQRALVREASRAPSRSNVQPARWRFAAADDDVVLLRAIGRELPIADPAGHDRDIALGAAWEGMAIALSRLGLALGAPHAGRTLVEEGLETVARGRIREGEATDPLAAVVDARRSWRGCFAPATPDSRARLASLAAPDVLVVDDPETIDVVARYHDRATWHFESDPVWHRERWRWLRLSRRDPRWGRDGLDADCLALEGGRRARARLALRPFMFTLLARLRLARTLVRETAEASSATGLLLFAPSRDLSPFDTGRRFYRLWLELTAAGLYALPMSATTDFAETRDQLAERVDLPADRRLAAILRVGIAPAPPASARLPVDDLLV